VNAVVRDASAAAEIAVRTSLGRSLLALAPRDRRWWVPDHFHIEAGGVQVANASQGFVDEGRATRAVDSLLMLPVTVCRSRRSSGRRGRIAETSSFRTPCTSSSPTHLDAPLLAGDRRIAGAPNLPIQVLHISVAD